jgi:Core-2/I-Branching enzyme
MSAVPTRLAYLILVHERPVQLARLVNALDGDASTFHVHVDAKVDLATFRRPFEHRPNVHFVDDRVAGQWMGFSLVAATLKLLRQAQQLGFDYCTLLSGADYPIKSGAERASFFARADKEYLSFWRLVDRPSWLHKVSYYYSIDAIPIAGWSRNREPAFWRRYFWGRFFKYQKHFPKRKFLKDLTAYGGSGWWSLSSGCVNHVLDYVDAHPEFVRFYRYTASPDEMFFQTIILNSPWAARVEGFDAYQRWSAERTGRGLEREDSEMLSEELFNQRYIDWSGEVSGERERPAILDQRDWQRIVASPSLFARKFDPERSADLLDRIDHEILRRA